MVKSAVRRSASVVGTALTVVLAASCTSGPAGPAPSSGRSGEPTASASSAASESGSATPSKRLVTQLTATTVPWRLPRGLSRMVVVPDRRALMIIGGLTSAGTIPTVTRVDPSTGRARTVGRLAVPVHDAAGASVGGRSLIFGGGSTGSVMAVQAVPPFRPGVVVGRLPRRRSDLGAAVIGPVAYLVGGYDGSRYDRWVLGTADGRTLRRTAALPVPVRYPAVAALSGAVYVFGGERPRGQTAVIQRIDPGRHTARIVGRLPTQLAHAAAIAFHGEIFLAGGVGPSGYSSRIWRFRPQRHDVTPAGRLPYAVSDAGAVVLGNVAYLVGGENPGELATSIKLLAR